MYNFSVLIMWLLQIYISEKAHLSRQKNNFNGKRGDRRNFKVSTKAKYDSFSVKASLASFSLAAAGNNFFGMKFSNRILFYLMIDSHGNCVYFILFLFFRENYYLVPVL